MITIRRQLLGLGVIAASSLLALNAAHALTSPQAINIDGGPLGSLALSGGVNGYGYYQSNTPNHIQTDGANVGSAIVELQKTSGVLQFTVELGSFAAGTSPGSNTNFGGGYFNGRLPQTSISNFSTGPLYAGYLTIAPPNLPVTVSAGFLPSIEGYEGGFAWVNASQFTTDIYFTENSEARGVQANLTEGPFALAVQFGDGWDTGVFNFVQALGTYTINSNNIANIYYAGNVSRTGLNAKTYSGDCSYGEANGSTCFGNVANYGAYYMNSQMIGGFYSYTMGNLNLVPEVQYVFAKADQALGLTKASSNLGAAVFADYTLANTPYSVGGWVQYENSNGPDSWFAGPKSQLVGAALAPTWQYKDLYARANAGIAYLLNNKAFSSASYGSNGREKFQFTGTLEAGLLF